MNTPRLAPEEALAVIWANREAIPTFDQSLWDTIFRASRASVEARRAGRIREADALRQVQIDATTLRARWIETVHLWAVIRSWVPGLGAAALPVGLPVAVVAAVVALGSLIVVILARQTQWDQLLRAYVDGEIPEDLLRDLLPTDWGQVATFGLGAVAIWGVVRLSQGLR